MNGTESLDSESQWVLDCIRGDPGCTVGDLVDLTGFTHQKVRSVLESLLNADCAREYRTGRSRHLFSSDHGLLSVWKQCVVLRCKEHRAFHAWLLDSGSVLQSAAQEHMAQVLGWGRKRLRVVIARLVDAGLVEMNRRGKWVFLVAKQLRRPGKP